MRISVNVMVQMRFEDSMRIVKNKIISDLIQQSRDISLIIYQKSVIARFISYLYIILNILNFLK